MALTKVGPAGIGSTPGTGYTIGDSFLHSTGLNATNAYYTGIVTSQSIRVLGDLQVDGTTTTLDTEVTSVDKLEVAANNTTVGVAITQSGSGDILNLYDGSTEVFSVADGGNVFIGNNADRTSFLNASSNNLQIDGGVIFEPGSGNDVEIYNYRTTAIKIGTGGAEKVRIASDGKIGIGTAIPAQKLHVFGNTGTNIQIEQTSGNIYLGSSGNTRFGLSSGANLIQSTSVDFAIGSFGGNSLIFGTNNSERLRITSDGNILVNHTDSDGSGKLQVFTGSQDGVDILGFSNNATAGGRLTFYRSKSAGVGNFSEVANGDSLGRIDWRGYNDDGTANNLGATIEALVSGNVDSTTDMPSDLVFKTSPDGSASPVERLRITSAGNIGIKNTSPNNTLTVGDGVQTSYAPPGGGNYIEIARTSGADAGLLINKNTGQWLVGIDNSDGANAPLRFEYGAAGSAHPGFGSVTPAMMMKHNGKIGIGTDNPLNGLDILQSDGRTRITAFGHIITQNHNNSTTNYWSIAPRNGGELDIGYGAADGNGTVDADKVTITTDGKVGIGTDNPTVNLEINKSAVNVRQLIKNTLDTGYAALSVGGSGGTLHVGFRGDSYASTYGVVGAGMGYIDGSIDDLGIQTIGNILFGTGTSIANIGEKLRITSAGNVNIGGNYTQTTYKTQITTGTNKHVSFGNAAHDSFSDEGSGIFFSRPSDGSKIISGVFQHTNASLGIATRGDLTLHAGGTSTYSASPERLRITSNGNVGIGSTIPTDILDIQTGSSDEVTKFKVKTAGQLELTRNHASAPYIKTLMGSGNPNIILGDSAGDKVKINGDGASYFNGGNLGIGTDNPTMPLQLNSTEQNVVKWVSSNSDGPITHYYNGSTQLGNLGNSKGVMSSSNLHFGIGSKSDLLFGTKPSGGGSTVERLRITSDGDVIITSTASPVSRAKLDVRMRSDHPGFNITHNDGSFYRHLGTVGPGSSDGSTGRYLHIRLRTVWNDLSMTMFRITGYYPYNVYGESYFGCYRYSDVNYRYIPFGQVISNQGNKAIIDSAYNTNANPGYLVIVCDWNTNYTGLMIEHYGAGGSYGSYMQHDLEIIDTKRSTSTAAQW